MVPYSPFWVWARPLRRDLQSLAQDGVEDGMPEISMHSCRSGGQLIGIDDSLWQGERAPTCCVDYVLRASPACPSVKSRSGDARSAVEQAWRSFSRANPHAQIRPQSFNPTFEGLLNRMGATMEPIRTFKLKVYDDEPSIIFAVSFNRATSLGGKGSEILAAPRGRTMLKEGGWGGGQQRNPRCMFAYQAHTAVPETA